MTTNGRICASCHQRAPPSPLVQRRHLITILTTVEGETGCGCDASGKHRLASSSPSSSSNTTMTGLRPSRSVEPTSTTPPPPSTTTSTSTSSQSAAVPLSVGEESRGIRSNSFTNSSSSTNPSSPTPSPTPIPASNISMIHSRSSNGSRALLLAVLFLCATTTTAWSLPMSSGADGRYSLRDQLGDELRAEALAESPPLSDRHIKMKLLEQLRHQQQKAYHNHHPYRQRLTDQPMIFDPSLEGLSLESGGSSGEWLASKAMPKQHLGDSNSNANAKQNQVETEPDGSSIVQPTKAPSLLGPEGLGADHPLQSIIQSGWIENASTATLIYYLKKISFMLSKENEDADGAGSDFENEPMIPEEDMILAKGPEGLDNTNNNGNTEINNSNQKQRVEKNKNVEVVLNRLMGTPNIVKKRGEGGPQLSIEYPLEVLRQKLMREIQRRQMESHMNQIDKNSKILEKLGRRRRKRSVGSVVDCDQVRCNLDDLNQGRKWSNLHQSLAKLVQRNPILLKRKSQKRNGGTGTGNGLALYNAAKTRFRNNDKYIKDPQEISEGVELKKKTQETLEFPSLAYHSSWVQRGRINSKKPNRLQYMSELTSTKKGVGPKRSDDWWWSHLRLRKNSNLANDDDQDEQYNQI